MIHKYFVYIYILDYLSIFCGLFLGFIAKMKKNLPTLYNFAKLSELYNCNSLNIKSISKR